MNEEGTRVRSARDSSVRALVHAALKHGISPSVFRAEFEQAAPLYRVPPKTTGEIVEMIDTLGQLTGAVKSTALTVEVAPVPVVEPEPPAPVVEPEPVVQEPVVTTSSEGTSASDWWFLDGLAIDDSPVDPISEAVRKAREDRIAFILGGGNPFQRFCEVVEINGEKYILVSTLKMRFEDGTMLNWSGSMKQYLGNAVSQCNRDFQGVWKGKEYKGTAWGYLHKHNPKAEEFWLWSNLTKPDGTKKDIVDKMYVQCVTTKPFFKTRLQKIPD